MKAIILRTGLCLDLGSPVDATTGRVDVNGSLESTLIAVGLFHDEPSLWVYM